MVTFLHFRLYFGRSSHNIIEHFYFLVQTLVVTLALIAVFINSILLLLVKNSRARTPGMIVLTVLEISLNLFLAGSFLLAMIPLKTEWYITQRQRYFAQMGVLIVVNTGVMFAHGVRNYWMLLLAVMRVVIVVDPLVQQRHNLRLLSVRQQGVMLAIFASLQLLLCLPLLLYDFSDNVKLGIRTSKVVLEAILPGIGMLVSTVLIGVKLNQRNNTRQLFIQTTRILVRFRHYF